MAIVVEDGTGKPDANSYASVAEADTYFSNVGFTDWAALELGVKESRLIQATLWLDAMSKFKGFKNTYEQALEWPRGAVSPLEGRVYSQGFGLFDKNRLPIPNTIVPVPIKHAVFELVRHGELPTLRDAQLSSKTVGPITRVWDTSRGPQSYRERFPLVFALLTGYEKDGGATGTRLARG